MHTLQYPYHRNATFSQSSDASQTPNFPKTSTPYQNPARPNHHPKHLPYRNTTSNFVLIKYSLCEGYQLIIGCHFEDTQLIKYSDCKDLLAGSDSFNEFDSNQLLGRDCPILFHGQMSFLLQFLLHLGPSNSVSSLHVLNFSVCCSSDQILFRSHNMI